MNHHVYEDTFDERSFPGAVKLSVYPENSEDWADNFVKTMNMDDCAMLLIMPSEGYLKLSNLYVPKPARGQGVGEALLNKAKEIAKERKLPLYALVEPFGDSPLPLADLLKWFGKQGFRRLGLTGPLAIVTIHPTRI